jgi:hypothetical protein
MLYGHAPTEIFWLGLLFAVMLGFVRPYKHGALRREYFRQSDLNEYRGIHPVEEDGQDQD